MPDLHSRFYILSFKNPCDCHTPISLSWARLPAKPGWGAFSWPGRPYPSPFLQPGPQGCLASPPCSFPTMSAGLGELGPRTGLHLTGKLVPEDPCSSPPCRNCGAKCVRSRTPSHSHPWASSQINFSTFVIWTPIQQGVFKSFLASLAALNSLLNQNHQKCKHSKKHVTVQACLLYKGK